LPETLVNIYIGWIHTDNIGVSSSDLVKYINVNNMQINESKDTMVAPTLTLDRILAGGNKSLVTKEYVDSLNTVFYVDAINGSDSNRGTSMDNAYKTIKKACDAVPIGGYGRIILMGGDSWTNAPTHWIDTSIYLYKKNIYIVVYYNYNGDTSKSYSYLRNKGRLVQIHHCNPNNDTWYCYIDGFRLYGSSITLSGQALGRDSNGVAYNPRTLRIQTANWLPDPNDGNVHLYGCSHNNGLVCNEALGGGHVEFRYIDYIALGDSHLISQSLSYQAANMSFTSIANIYGNGPRNRSYISAPYSGSTPSMTLAPYYVTLGDDKDGNTYTWQNAIAGVVRDSNNVPRNIDSSFVF
jgi:hypothetical protein